MPSVFESVIGLVGRAEVADKLGALVGTDRAGVERATQVATPALLSGISSRMAGPGGARAVFDLLDGDNPTAVDDLDGFLDRGDSGLGSGIVETIFGSDRGTVISRLAGSSGLDAGLLGRFLPMLAPLVMGLLARRRNDDGLDHAGFAALLNREQDDIQRRGLAGDLVGTARATAPPAVAAVPRIGAAAATASRGGFRWLLPALIGLAVLSLAAIGLSQCDGDDDLDASLPDVEVTAPEGEVTVPATDLDLDAVKAALAGAGFDGLDVSLDGDKVTVGGEVADDTTRNRILSVLEGLPGVGSVVDKMTVTTAPTATTATTAPTATSGSTATTAAAPVTTAAAGATINELLDLDPVTFEVSSARITSEGEAVLDEAAAYLTANATVKVEIGGHTDSDGNDATNLALSETRAESVKTYLEGKGIASDRMTTKGYGETTPKVANDSPANKAINRRIEFTVQ